MTFLYHFLISFAIIYMALWSLLAAADIKKNGDIIANQPIKETLTQTVRSFLMWPYGLAMLAWREI